MSAQLRLWLALGTVFAAYGSWAALTARLVPFAYGYQCSQRFFTISCNFPQDEAVASAAYPALLLFILLIVGIARWRFKHAAAYPFLALTGGMCAGALAWDMVAMRPILLAPKIINDTVDVLGAVIAASFTLLVVLCRKNEFSLLRLAQAAVTSYGLTLVSVLAFVELSKTVFGVTELFLLYVIYAFGSFTLHLMTVCGLVAKLPSGVPARSIA